VPGRNGGLIRRGSPKGNTPGPGRPKSALRERMRHHLDKDVLTAVLRDFKAGKHTSLEVAEFLARYGLGTQSEVLTAEKVAEEQRALVETFSAALRAELSEDVATRVVTKFRELWGER